MKREQYHATNPLNAKYSLNLLLVWSSLCDLRFEQSEQTIEYESIKEPVGKQGDRPDASSTEVSSMKFGGYFTCLPARDSVYR